ITQACHIKHKKSNDKPPIRYAIVGKIMLMATRRCLAPLTVIRPEGIGRYGLFIRSSSTEVI
ncbi:22626_t:CDS:1, partial [Gigaspora rosea]